ncbi:unnamed protein product [Calicophoron daubneyi]|uniref:Uncharacterized protein n=1 Tax=Calicophoron daubneyi TaxID=300641 RepID=A0AAV2T5X1_CALDB
MLSSLELSITAIFITASHAISTGIIFLKPENVIIYQNKVEDITLCIYSNQRELCSRWEKRNFPEAVCEYKPRQPASSDHAWQRFSHRLLTKFLDAGTYRFVCRLNKKSAPTITTILILPNDDLYCDWAAETKEIRMDQERRVYPACCYRPLVRSQWLAGLHMQVRLCQNVDCTTSTKMVVAQGGWLHVATGLRADTHRFQVECGQCAYSERFYLLDPVKNLHLVTQPSGPVILAEQHEWLRVCVLTDTELGCPEVDKQVEPIVCFVETRLPTTNRFIKFTNELEVSTLTEGEYTVWCFGLWSGTRNKFTVFILHNGEYVWNCSMAPDVIYLDEEKLFRLCTWRLVTDSPMLYRLKHEGLTEQHFTCHLNVDNLTFINGLIEANQIHIAQGAYKVVCRGLVVKSHLFIITRRHDITISLFPLQTLINKMETGKFLAQLNWNEVSQEKLITLRRKFPVTCRIMYVDSPTTPTITFTRYLYYGHLNQGLITVDCSSPPLKIRRIFRKFIALQTDRPDENNRRLSNHRNTTITKIPPSWNTESGNRCIIPGAIYSSDGSKITVNVPELSSHYAEMICPDYKHNVAYVHFNAEIALKISPDQPFYVFDRLDHVHISCSTIDEDVKPIPIDEIKCTVRTPSGEYIGPKTSKAGLLKEIIDSEIRPYCGEYDIKCQCPTVKEPSELTITIMGESHSTTQR